MKKILIIVITIILLVAGGLGILTYQKYHNRQLGMQAFKEKDYEKTQNYLEKSRKQFGLAMKTEDYDSGLYLADSYLKTKQYEKSIKMYKEIGAKTVTTYSNVAYAYENLKEDKMAIKYYKMAVKKAKTDKERCYIYNALMEIAKNKNDSKNVTFYAKKATGYVESILKGKMQSNLVAMAADIYYYAGDYKQARTWYKQLEDDEVQGLIGIGRSYMAEKQFDEAYICLQRAQEITKDANKVVLLELAKYYEQKQDYQKALEYTSKINDGTEIEKNVKKDCMFLEIAMYEKQINFEKAYEIAKEYVKAYPKDTHGQKELAFLKTRI